MTVWQTSGHRSTAVNTSSIPTSCHMDGTERVSSLLSDLVLYVFAAFGALGVVCNGLLLLTLLIVPIPRCRSSRFIISLALADLTLCLLLTSPAVIKQVSGCLTIWANTSQRSPTS